MTPHHFRAIALGLPEAAEGSHLGRADFRAGGKIFATLTPELGIGMVKLTPEQQEMLCAAEPRIFTPVPGGWGRRGATHIRLEAIDEATLTSALGMAFRNVAPKRLKAELDRKPTKVVGGDAPASARAERDRPTLSVRKARRTEAEAMSQLMVRAIRETNARDYEPSIIEALAANFAAPEVERRMHERLVFIARIGEEAVGTVSLSPSASKVHSVFVDPSRQGQGIGAALMAFIEKRALKLGHERLSLSSSLTAVSFYRSSAMREPRAKSGKAGSGPC
jgi:GNAT superfamily N-acetyltransferase